MKQILVDIKDLTDMLESSQKYECCNDCENAQGALDNIRDTLRFILHDSGAVIDPDIAMNDGIT